MRFMRGFTLIELLVVLSILGVALSFVGPLTVQQYENVRRDSEIQQVVAYLDKARYRALNARESLTIIMSGKQVSSEHPLISEPLLTEYITFPSQTLIFNENGFANTDQATIRFGENNMAVQLEFPVY